MKRRKVRTFLTMLGVTIGVISVVALLSIGIGVKREMVNTLVDSGSVNRITVYGASGGKHKDRMLTDRTIEKLSALDNVESCYPLYEVAVTLRYGKYTYYGNLTGVPREQLEALTLGSGTYGEASAYKPSLIVGDKVSSMFFSDSSDRPLSDDVSNASAKLVGSKLAADIGMEETSQTIKLDVAGVISDGNEEPDEVKSDDVESDDEESDDEEMSFSYSNDSYMIYCDIDVLTSYLRRTAGNGLITGQPVDENGNNYSEFIYTSAVVCVDDIDNVDFVVKKLQDMGYQTENEKEYLDTVQRYLKIIQLLLGGIGMIALIVAVIGISNTMTTSVFDRINEIGVLKVLGCDIDELRLLFLTEAAVIGAAGGVLGVAASYGVKLIIDRLAVVLFHLSKGTVVSVIPWWLALAGVVGSVVLGVLAGYFPARWAAKLRPIDAVQRR